MNRKQFIKASSGIIVGGVVLKMSMKNQKAKITSYTQNPDLKTIRPNWPGTPLDQNGLFTNQYLPHEQSFVDVLKWQMSKNPQRQEKKDDPWHLQVIENMDFVADNTDKLVWLGHASYYIQLAGKKILIDPIFGAITMVKRLTKMPIDVSKFVGIDYILISHAHYDHCDKDSITQLCKQNPKAQIKCGLKLDQLIKKWANNDIETAGWYQQYNHSADLKISFVPSRHWANRYTWDVNTTLWGGFVIEANDKSIYFAGDSGKSQHFKEIAEVWPNLTVAMIGIGAYKPEWFMGPSHQNPVDASKAFLDTKAQNFIPFHFGTFDLSDEPLGEPLRMIQGISDSNLSARLKALKIGEVFRI